MQRLPRIMIAALMVGAVDPLPAHTQILPRIPRDRVDTATAAAPIRRDTTVGRRAPEVRATLTGIVRDAETGAPLPAYVVPARRWELTDAEGRYTIHSDAAGPQTVRFQQRGFLTEHHTVRLLAGQTVTLDVSLRRTPAPCCALEGTWSVRFVLEETGFSGRPEPADSVVEGLLTFADSIGDPFPGRMPHPPNVRTEYGLSDVDFSPFFDGPLAPGQTTRLSANGYPLSRIVSGDVFHGDSVEITLIPGMSHGGVVMWGRIAGDVVRGTWFQQAYARGASGTFEMRRVARGRD